MARIRATVTRWVDDVFPGWVEVELIEADGSVATLVDKVPIFTDSSHLTPETAYPSPWTWTAMCSVVNVTDASRTS